MDVTAIANTVIFGTLVLCAARAARWARRQFLLSRIPGPKDDLVSGQMKHFSQRSDHHKALQRWAAEFGGIYRIRLVDTTVRFQAREWFAAPYRIVATVCLCCNR